MHRLVLLFFLIEVFPCQGLHPSTPAEFRGLWCISTWNAQRQNYSEQVGQAFFYNNETFTLNLLNDMTNTWINHFVRIEKADDGVTYQIFTDTTKGPPNYLNKVSCFWRRQIPNGDILWGRQSNGSCIPSFEVDDPSASTRYTRQASNCRYVDDESPNETLSSTPFEPELLQFDRSMKDTKRQAIVFYGSSSIRFWSTLPTDFPHLREDLINRGFGGSTLKQCRQQFKRVILPLDPRLLVIYAGENDIAEDQTPAVVQERFHQLISVIRRFFPSLPIVFVSIKPSPSRADKTQPMNKTNRLIKEDIARMTGVHYVDIFNKMLTADGRPRPELYLEDDLHMNEQGYAIWTQTLNDYLLTHGLISKGLNNTQISMLVVVFHLIVAYIGFVL